MAKDKRVEVLFEPQQYKRLEEAAHREGKAVGAVIRDAVAKYVVSPSEEERQRAFEHLLSMQVDIDPGSPEDIKAVIISGLDEYLDKNLAESEDEDEAS